jgi:hypothetical protein
MLIKSSVGRDGSARHPPPSYINIADAFDPFDPDEWGDKPVCSAFETALNMRGRGALSASAIPAVICAIIWQRRRTRRIARELAEMH